MTELVLLIIMAGSSSLVIGGTYPSMDECKRAMEIAYHASHYSDFGSPGLHFACVPMRPAPIQQER